MLNCPHRVGSLAELIYSYFCLACFILGYYTQIVKGKIDVKLGGGELGRGFYTGQYEHEAKTWAFHQTGTREKNVVKLTQDSKDLFSYHIQSLDITEATNLRTAIRKKGETRIFLIGCDIVTSQIVGSTKVNGCQVKWESEVIEKYLNSANTHRNITW